MTDAAFTPVLYVREGCPFCLKVRLFLLEAGLLDKVTLVQAPTPEKHEKLAESLTARTGSKASFPTAEIAPDRLLADSDVLVAHFAKEAGVDPAALPTYQAYAAGVFPSLQKLFRENAELKQKLG